MTTTASRAGTLRPGDTSRSPQGGRPITGRTVLLWISCFFGVIFAANAAFLYFAFGSFPGTVVDSSYKAGLTFNAEVAAAEAQAARGWDVSAHLDRSGEGRARITVSARDGAGLPLAGLAFVARLAHPTAAGQDQTVSLAPLEDGRYTGVTAAPLAPGTWKMTLEADGPEGRLFRSENRLFLRD
ncbi:nitrogen fixation protein FixH [Microvirga tunisiensis]|uniref:Nitrogen fixation protein FixH n=2 Tax=Pannonibacter tanglangensis TaxID=2750084 RepID=A0A7X5F4S6_9HYPH|nr:MULTISPECIES: FixH family protein [unclassified Pannonibacter]NBN64242.1 nitrogen fixation protein FixH [Pannonibacter sp. XCT-34]NBN78775.1 nitrogen fixation protein FixH [Pannonibacter sp. XCT-53]